MCRNRFRPIPSGHRPTVPVEAGTSTLKFRILARQAVRKAIARRQAFHASVAGADAGAAPPTLDSSTISAVICSWRRR